MLDVLPELSRDVLREEFGIAAFGDQVRIVNGIKALSTASSATATPATAIARTVKSEPTPPVTMGAPLRDENALDLVVLHAAPLVIKDSKGRIYPMEKLDLEAERRAITSSLLTDVRHKAIHVRFDIATADILRSLMTAWRCKVLHFSGHGLGQRAAVCFEDGAGCTHLITPELLRQLTFSGLPRTAGKGPVTGPDADVQLVFVNACHSEKVASVFLNAGIPHVVAVRACVLLAFWQARSVEGAVWVLGALGLARGRCISNHVRQAFLFVALLGPLGRDCVPDRQGCGARASDPEASRVLLRVRPAHFPFFVWAIG